MHGNERLSLVGGPGRDRLLGGDGPGLMLGGDGRDLFEAGPGDDRPILTKDGIAEIVRGGTGRDEATVDRVDKIAGVEVVKR